MPRRSQSEMAILGGLSMQPMTAYALREAIKDVLGHFWSESFGQIYPALSQLEQQGLVTRSHASRPGSSVYSVTPAGLERLRELLCEPVVETPPRHGLLLRLFFGRILGPDQCRELLLTARATAERRIAEYEAIERKVREEDAGSPDLPYVLITLSSGIHGSRAQIEWATEALALLGDQTSAGNHPPRPKESQP